MASLISGFYQGILGIAVEILVLPVARLVAFIIVLDM